MTSWTNPSLLNEHRAGPVDRAGRARHGAGS
jgi:hypothetical protein